MIPIVGITGGIGSGKSTVACLFARQGIPTLDLDDVGRHILTHDIGVQKELCDVFGYQIMHDDDLSINRSTLADTAFKSQASIDALNYIMHPAIRQYEIRWRMQQTTKFAMVEASVLIESQQCPRMDATIVVFSDESIRRMRVLQRGKQTNTVFNAIIARQCNDAQRRKAADYSLENNHDLQNLTVQQQTLYQQLCLYYNQSYYNQSCNSPLRSTA